VALALAAPAAALSPTAWSQFRANPQGTSQGSVVGAQSARPEPGFPAALPAEPNGAGFPPGGVALGASGVAFVGQGPTLSAYSPSGKRFWTYTGATAGGDTPPNINGPALSASGSTVYALNITFNLFTAPSSSLIALNASNGALRWSAPVGTLAAGLGIAEPTVTVGPDGSLYVAANIAGTGIGPAGSPGPITNATVTDFTPYGGVNWSTVVSGPVSGGPVLDPSGNVYVAVGGGTNGGEVVALSASGALLWSTALVTPGGSTIYVATQGNNGTVYALGASDGAIVGTIGSGGIKGTLALSPRTGFLYAGTSSGLVSALPSGGGSPAWSSGTPADGTSVTAPAIGADSTVYATGGNTLVAVSGTTGATKWSFTTPSTLDRLSSPVIGPSGDIYVTSQSLDQGTNQLYAFAGPP
jgi:outer membrane protein assembly factor BamB